MDDKSGLLICVLSVGIFFGLLIGAFLFSVNTGRKGDEWMPHPFFGANLHINCTTLRGLASTAYANEPLWMERPEYEDRFIESFSGQRDMEIQTCKEYTKGK